MLEPFTQALTPELTEHLANLKASPDVQVRVSEPAEKYNEEELTENVQRRLAEEISSHAHQSMGRPADFPHSGARGYGWMRTFQTVGGILCAAQVFRVNGFVFSRNWESR